MMNDTISKMLVQIVLIMILLLIVLALTLIWLSYRKRMREKKEAEAKGEKRTKIQQEYNIQSVLDFMEFDKIEDNMIIQRKGRRYVMVVKCQGINYDLLSEMEKISTEQGFVQYLNTLKSPVQIYVQTRTVDLSDSLEKYRRKIEKLENNLRRREYEYAQKEKDAFANRKEVEKAYYNLIKARNIYEYGIDILNDTERMSQNKNILSKQFYTIFAYSPDETMSDIRSENELRNIAFSELYTKAQSTISLLYACGVSGKILDSNELAELLYIAYNRDESETYDLKKALNVGVDNMYVTAPDVLDKKMQELNKKIEEEAMKKAEGAINQAIGELEKERILKKREKELDKTIEALIEYTLEENRRIYGDEVIDRAKEKLGKEEEKEDVKKKRKPGRTRKTA